MGCRLWGHTDLDTTEVTSQQKKQKILRRGEKYTQKNYLKKKKDLHNPENHDGVIIHLEPVIWEY